MHVCTFGPTSGVEWAVQVFGVLLLLAGFVLAPVGFALSSFDHDQYASQPRWRVVFRAGFTVQLSSVFVSAVASLVFLLMSPLGLADPEALTGVVFGVSAIAGCFALAAWRRLLGAVPAEAPPSLRAR